jgi:DNA-binding helix-hairpin-helix protein with protein kinase domain
MKVWAYMHPELKILCCALLPEAVPEGIQAVELEVETPDEVVLDNGQIRLKTEAEKLAEEKQKKLSELKTYVAGLLAQTDYVITKIAEAQIQNDTEEVEALKQRYATQLQQREVIRQWNKQMKQAIMNVTSLEELRGIRIEFRE